MQKVRLGKTGIVTVQNAFGALPMQRVGTEESVHLVRRAFEGGMLFFDTARLYSDSEEKLGIALEGLRDEVWIATKTMATTPQGFWKDLETSLAKLRCDYIDVYQFHNPATCYKPGDGTGMYECMLEAREKGLIRHIGITAHRSKVAEQAIASGLYETLQYPFSYLSTQVEHRLYQSAKRADMGFIAMKGLAGGLITNSRAAMAFMSQYDNALPIWGIQHEEELDEWLSFMEEQPAMDDEVRALIEADRKELIGGFCRGCGYCMPCPAEISIKDCARMSLMIRRAPSSAWLSEKWQAEMDKIDSCLDCGLCMSKCPYDLPTPQLLRDNLADYRAVLAGEVEV